MHKFFKGQRQRALAAALVGGAALGTAGNAQAALTENLAVSVVGMSMGNAVTADPPGLDSIHFNPAGLARIKTNRRQDAVFGASIKPYASFHQPDGFDIGGWKNDPIAGTSTGPVRQAIYLPMYGSPSWSLPAAVAAGLGLAFHEPDSKWTFGTATYVPQGVGIDRTKDPNDPARFDGRKVVIQRLVYLSPTAAYQVSDTLSLGVSVPIAHQGFMLNTAMRMPNELLGIIGKLQDAWCGDSGNPLDTLGFGLCGGGKEGRLRPFNTVGDMTFDMTAPMDPTLNIGVLWEPKDWFAMGAVYQFGSSTVLTGRYDFEAAPVLRKFVQGLYSSLQGPILAAAFGMPTSIPASQTGNATLVLPFPEHVQAGIKIKPLSFLQFNVDVNWTNWARWDKMTFQFDQQISLLQMARIFGQGDASKLVIPRGYKSPIHFGYGVDLSVGQHIHLRGGYEPRKTSVPSSAMDLIAPLPDLKVFSVGAGYQADSGLRIDATASYAHGRFNLPANTSCNLNCTNFSNVIYNPYAGLDINGGIYIRYFGISLSHPF
ncbi:OmpP1/FadL family transporter [Roseateles koreensis]|uniref:Outer membrane protein transport protein n=1 Tax=Roseateles koreensis TaxID=2987526 RepID=A0ABT5KRD7_9BURK|nr:outer membrane protein transport protein [Roseateles koreensis]MDC8785030.1 outer membrane protein transport protein [Roseateles koreensis]